MAPLCKAILNLPQCIIIACSNFCANTPCGMRGWQAVKGRSSYAMSERPLEQYCRALKYFDPTALRAGNFNPTCLSCDEPSDRPEGEMGHRYITIRIRRQQPGDEKTTHSGMRGVPL